QPWRGWRAEEGGARGPGTPCRAWRAAYREKRDDGVPSGELVGPGVEQEDGEQHPCAADLSQVRTQPIEQRQRGRTLEAEWQVAEVTRQRHLEQLGPLEERNGVDPSARATPVQPFPEEAERRAECHDAQGNAHTRERFGQRPEEDPGERECVPGKRERGEQHRECRRDPPPPTSPQTRRPRLGTG